MSEKLGQLDIVFVVDNTGSMGPYINAVKVKILEIIRTIKKEELVHRLRVGLVSYRDHPPEDESFVTKKYELSPDTSSIEGYVKEMVAHGGGDGPEAVCDALHVANRMEFLNESAKVVILIGDAPPHGVEPSGDNFPDGCPDGHNWEEESQRAFDIGVVIHTVGCTPQINRYKSAIDAYKKIAENSKGNFFPLEKADLLVGLITGIAMEEIDKIGIQQSILEELGASMEDLPDDVEVSPGKLAEIASKLRGKGVTKRAVRHSPAAASGLADTVEAVEVEEAQIDEEDIKEALRQLKSKSKD
ncbi:MAG: VWA domain-containing protein [Candidatus Thorarchaeota archaeon]|nr:MAG: VWA domain-containing protein [Candidatus Thorarchaeota archaeon]